MGARPPDPHADSAIATSPDAPADVHGRSDGRRTRGVSSGAEEAVRAELASRFRIGPVRRRAAGHTVFAATHANGKESVELHVLDGPPATDVTAMRRELDGLITLDHPHIVSILDFGAGSRFIWYSTRPTRGRPLDEQLAQRGPLQLQPCLRLVEQIASAIQFAHRRGVVHGAIRPACVLVDDQGWAFLDGFLEARVQRTSPIVSHTRFEAPESAIGIERTPATDQYALAATIIECLAGAPPDDEEETNPAERIDEIPLNGENALTAHVREALRRATLLHPADRFGTVLEFVAALTGSGFHTGAAATPPRLRGPAATNPHLLFVDDRHRRRSPLALAIVLIVLGLGGFAALLLLRNDPSVPRPESFQEPPPPAQPVSDRAVMWQDTVQPALVGNAQTTSRAADPPVQPVQPPPPIERPQPRRVQAAVPERERIAPPAVERTAADTQQTGSRARSESVVDTTPALAAGRLFISSRPWGNLYVDGQLIGNTPRASLSITAGVHTLRIVRDGFRTWERQIQVAPGQEIRIVDIVLEEMSW
jgi:serine/threonine protein kinase